MCKKFRTKSAIEILGKIFPLLLCCFFIPAQAQENGLSHLIEIGPIKPSFEPALVVLVPGAHRDPQEYVDLVHQIQVEARLTIAVEILRFTANYPNPLELTSRIQEAIQQGRRLPGFQNLPLSRVFVGGHSLGGFFARREAVNSAWGGLILLSAYLNGAPQAIDGIARFPIPVLSLTGERDGLTPLTRMAFEWARIPQPDLRKPVVILRDVNHSQFSSGRLQASDFISPLSTAEAHRRIAKTISNFMTLLIYPTRDTRAAPRLELESAIRDTGLMVAPFLKALGQDQTQCGESQLRLAWLTSPTAQRIRISTKAYEDLLGFAGSKPILQPVPGGQLEILDTFRAENYFNPGDFSVIPSGRQTLSCKMKSQAAILASIPDGKSEGPQRSCQELNLEILNWAAKQVSESQLKRFLSEGHGLIPTADLQTTNGPSWLAARLEIVPGNLKQSRGVFALRSPALNTALDAPAPFDGMAYCKLMPPSRAVEWILVEGFRENPRN